MRGFSLVELSIVIAIIGLLVGGVLAGQNLMRNAAVNSIASDFNKYSTAITSFEEKYGDLPGDLENATAYWGKNNSACAAHTGTASARGTCNGNGDGIINAAAGANATGENFQMWHQLSLAELISGTYTGIAGSVGGNDYDFGVNAPDSRIENAGWGHYGFDNASGGNGYMFANNYNGWLTVGSEDDNSLPDGPILSPKEAWQIDRKMDDGEPATGFVHVLLIGACSTASGTTDFDAEYLLNDTPGRCALVFKF